MWKAPHDWALLKGLLKYGYGRWQDILLDPLYKLQEVLHQELNIDLAEIMAQTSSEQPATAEGENPQASPSDRTQPHPQHTLAKLRSTETRCRNWLASRVRLLAEGLSEGRNRESPASKKNHIAKRGRGRGFRGGRQTSSQLDQYGPVGDRNASASASQGGKPQEGILCLGSLIRNLKSSIHVQSKLVCKCSKE